MGVAHFAFNFRTWDQGGDRIDHQYVDRVGTDQCVDNFQRLFTGVGLRDDQLVGIDAQCLGIDGVQRMFRVDKSRCAAIFLGFGNDVQSERGLARTFRSVNLDHASLWQSPDAKRDIQSETTSRNGFDFESLALAQLHRRALAEGAVDLRQCGVERLLPV